MFLPPTPKSATAAGSAMLQHRRNGLRLHVQVWLWQPSEPGQPSLHSQPPCHRLGISHVAGHTLPRHPIGPLPWGVIGYQRQIDQTRLKIDAQPASQSLICAAMTSGSASRHRHHTQTLGMRVGTLPTSLVPDGQLY